MITFLIEAQCFNKMNIGITSLILIDTDYENAVLIKIPYIQAWWNSYQLFIFD